jgi:hypothetical protein
MGRRVNLQVVPDIEHLHADGHFVVVILHPEGHWTVTEINPKDYMHQ